MRVNYNCPSCQQANQAEVVDTTDKMGCTACDWKRLLPADPHQRTHPTACLACGCRDLWRRKNFPPQIGVGIVVLAAILSTIAYAWHQPLWSYGFLMAAAAIDMILFALMQDVMVCYRCGARYLNFDPAGETPHFNLETAERHRQEKIRLNKN